MLLWIRTFQLGVKSLLLHPLRSILTMLGILIGVWAVIVLTAVSQGASDQVQKQIASLGANTIIVRSQKPPEEKLLEVLAEPRSLNSLKIIFQQYTEQKLQDLIRLLMDEGKVREKDGVFVKV